MRRTGPNLSADHRRMMVDLYLAGIQPALLAPIFKVHPVYIRVAARRMGVTRKGQVRQ